MDDDKKNKKDSIKIDQVRGTSRVREVERTEEVGEVSKVSPTGAIRGVKRSSGVSGKRRATRIMSLDERNQLLQMVNEETEKMVQEGLLPKSQTEVVRDAVRSALVAALPTEEDEKE